MTCITFTASRSLPILETCPNHHIVTVKLLCHPVPFWGALNLQGMEFARKGGGNCKERKIQGKAAKCAFMWICKEINNWNLQGMRMPIQFKLTVLVCRCLHGTASPYLMDSCTLTAEVTGRQHLRSATQRKLVVPRYWLNSFGRRHFSVAGPSTWNSLPDSLRDPELSLDTFKRQLKTCIFAKYWWQNVLSALEIFLSMRYINLHFTYLLTYSLNGLCCVYHSFAGGGVGSAIPVYITWQWLYLVLTFEIWWDLRFEIWRFEHYKLADDVNFTCIIHKTIWTF